MGSLASGQTAKRPARVNKERVTRVRMDDEDIAILETYADFGFSSRSELIRELLHWWDEGNHDMAALPAPGASTQPTPAGAADPNIDALVGIVSKYVGAVNAVGNNLNQVAADLNRRRKAGDDEPLTPSEWDDVSKTLSDCTEAIEKSNQILLKLNGVQGTPKDFGIPKPLGGGRA